VDVDGRPTEPQAEARSALRTGLTQAGHALDELAARDPELSLRLARLVAVIASEAAHNQRFAKALSEAWRSEVSADREGLRAGQGRQRTRRNAGPWDPFAVYAEQGEAVLRDRLANLDLEQLRDILAEHGMDTDRLAMKWRDPGRVVQRIVDRVVDRAAKGDAFRGPHGQR
jgi:hypothetical protein